MRIYITPEARQRLDLYVEGVTGEISGLGTVVKQGNGLTITDIFLLKQESSGSATDLDANGVAEFLGEYMSLGRDPKELKLWWHSHGHIGAFWSGTDDRTAQSFGNEWMLSLVVNQDRDYKCRLDVYEPLHLTLDNIEVAVSCPMASKELREAVKAEIAEKVQSFRFTTISDPSTGYWWNKGENSMEGYSSARESNRQAIKQIEERERGGKVAWSYHGRC